MHERSLYDQLWQLFFLGLAYRFLLAEPVVKIKVCGRLALKI